ncbi:efflux RND transporter periplasmic adaptor subunit [Flavobacterium ovatum]|uniref:efflux RND transporter periplasmic adaptor subunit n=1 Tax=Flavobacterium ovatum TaxID=1928857 RepID=UPI00344BD618
MKKAIAILSITSLFLVSCGKEKKEEIKSEPAITVQTAAVVADGNNEFITASGKVEAMNSADLSTRMMGNVTKLNVKVGQNVQAGQVVVTINSADLSAKKAQVDASILQATAAYKNAKKDYDRFSALFKQQSASPKELDDMTARYEMAKAGLEGAKQMRNEVMAQFNYANITAPFSGVVTNTFVKEGDMASPGMPLVSIEGVSKLQVVVMVSESDITAIKNNMQVTVNIKSLNKEVSGKVSAVSLSSKNTGAQYLVKINLDKMDKSILSGMFVNVQFETTSSNKSLNASTDRVLVPLTALVHKGQLTGIYTIANNTAILRWLRIGKTFGGDVEVLSGLTSNEQYITDAEGKLYNGAKVSIK